MSKIARFRADQHQRPQADGAHRRVLGARVQPLLRHDFRLYKDKEALFKFEGTSLKEWITKVGTMEYLGTTYGLNIGPMPRAPTDDTIKML